MLLKATKIYLMDLLNEHKIVLYRLQNLVPTISFHIQIPTHVQDLESKRYLNDEKLIFFSQ